MTELFTVAIELTDAAFNAAVCRNNLLRVTAADGTRSDADDPVQGDVGLIVCMTIRYEMHHFLDQVNQKEASTDDNDSDRQIRVDVVSLLVVLESFMDFGQQVEEAGAHQNSSAETQDSR